MNEKPPTFEVHKPARFKRIASAVVADESTNLATKLHEAPRICEFSRTRLQIPTNFHESANVADEPTKSHEPTNVRGPTHGHTLHTSKAGRRSTGGAWIEPARAATQGGHRGGTATTSKDHRPEQLHPVGGGARSV